MATMMSSVHPPPTSENHLHAMIIILLKLFSEPWNLEYISITTFLNIRCLSAQRPAWLPYSLTLLAQVPRLSDVQLLLHIMEI